MVGFVQEGHEKTSQTVTTTGIGTQWAEIDPFRAEVTEDIDLRPHPASMRKGLDTY
jgi:hypothetical protein